MVVFIPYIFNNQHNQHSPNIMNRLNPFINTIPGGNIEFKTAKQMESLKEEALKIKQNSSFSSKKISEQNYQK